ncbi:MAG: SpoIIE family protein phosphatase [Calditrichia bacterium]
MRILIAEDDLISRRLLQRRLENWGHQVVTAENGTQAWEIYRQENFPMVISDWMMPEMDGVELIRRIRENRKTGYVYTILLTAKQQKKDLISGMDAGADDFLTKPFDAEELRVRIRAGERIIELEQSLAEQNRKLFQANQRMHHHLDAAALIQKSLLPPPDYCLPGVKVAWYFKPCEKLAGDIFNYFPLNEEFNGFYILDVSGHGVSAALRAVMLSQLLNPQGGHSSLLVHRDSGASAQRIVPPADVANQLNRNFPLDQETGQFFTLFYGIYHRRKKQLNWISAGHPAAIYLPAGKPARFLDAPGFPIGFNDTGTYHEKTLALHSGDRLFLYSDGITEARNPADILLGKDHIVSKLVETRTSPLDKSLDSLLQTIRKWSGEEDLQDDVTMLAIEIE